MKIRYSQGFNPRPKLSLPLPRSVGLEADDDLLCLRVNRDPNQPQATNHESRIKAGLSAQLPDSLSILDCRFSVVNAKSSIPKPCLAAYVITVRKEYINDKLKTRIRRLLASESLNLQRRRPIADFKSKIENRKSKMKLVDVRPFLKSVELKGRDIIVECKITSAGSIRVDEILKLLELDVEMLEAPIRRTSVKWQEKTKN